MKPLLGIPERQLTQVRNLTPFAGFPCCKMGPGRVFFDTVVIKGTFDLVPGRLALSAAQAPVLAADEPFDPDAGSRSSLRRAGEVLAYKPGADVLVTGTAKAPGGVPAPAWDTSVTVTGKRGTILRHALQAVGPRAWQHRTVRGWALSDPEPAAEAPIRYELGYGGAYRDREGAWRMHEPNPSGTGFFDPGALDRDRSYPAPRWQSRAHPVTAMSAPVPLAGYGPVPRPWASRLRYAGTYDEAWERKAREDAGAGLPIDYPADFDSRFFQCAPPELAASEPLAGDEAIALAGLVAGDPRFEARLPGIAVKARLFTGSGPWVEQAVPLDTVHVDLDAAAVHLCWRLSLDHRLGVKAAVFFPEDRS
jgi:hypothetical protein